VISNTRCLSGKDLELYCRCASVKQARDENESRQSDLATGKMFYAVIIVAKILTLTLPLSGVGY
jgi:hypothetical protein